MIDCETRRIVPAVDSKYLALSYLWGSDQKNSKLNDNSEVLPSEIPETIEDAIAVKLRLDFRYLWIDRYCIDQGSAEAHAQIQQMDLVYQNAEVTIVAAAGNNPSHGLPGVGRRHRSLQPRVKVGKHLLFSTLQDPRLRIKGSSWMSRGWTYQEALLSRRRLVFTDEQIYYECYGMWCYEALNLPLQNLHTKDRQRFRTSHCDSTSIGLFPWKGVGRNSWEVADRIEEYSRRSLTYESDILNGFL